MILLLAIWACLAGLAGACLWLASDVDDRNDFGADDAMRLPVRVEAGGSNSAGHSRFSYVEGTQNEEPVK